MPRTFYTLDDLYLFCKTNNFTKFNAVQHGAPLIVQSIETFESTGYSKDGLLYVKLKACHIDKNRNGSGISEKTMNAHKDSFKGRPILASIIKTDKDTYEFHSHDMEIDKDGNLEYIEQPVGVISQLTEPYLEYDKDNDKTYLMVDGHVFEDYSKAAEILQRHKTCRCSVEISVDEMSYNADEDYLSIDAFTFRGVTILGYEQDGETVIQEGMEGSRITIEDFSADKNSRLNINYQDKLIETLEKLNNTLSSFNINNNMDQEEVSEEMGHFDELLAKYGVELEAIDFEYEGLNDEELDAIFEEKFGSSEEVVVEEEFEEGSEEELTDEQEEEVVITEESEEHETDEGEEHEEEHSEEFSFEDVVISFKISHEDVRYGIQNLLNAMNGDSHYYVAHSVYDSFFYYEDWMSNDAFKQNYKMRKDVISFNGDPIPVFREFVTQEEKDELEGMRKNYALLKEFKDNYDAAELKAKKDEIFGRKEFKALENNEEFKTLKDNMDSFTVEEIESQAKQIFADHVIANGQFALENIEEPEQKPAKIGFNFANKSKKAQAYSGLFDE